MPVSEATWLRPLAERIDEDAAAISVYLDLSPSSTATPADMATRVRSAVDALGSLASSRASSPTWTARPPIVIAAAEEHAATVRERMHEPAVRC